MTRDARAELERAGVDAITIDGLLVRAGSRVILHPRSSTDVLMRAVDGRRAIVDAVMQDLDDNIQLTVTLEDDPARTLGKGRWLGHRFFFCPDELEPLGERGGSAAPPRVLVAGIGNVFMGDDGFGVEVAARLAERPLPDGVDVVDFGIRGIDLAFALGDGYQAVVIVDATPRGQAPGTVELIEPEIPTGGVAGLQAHGMDPVSVLRTAAQFGAVVPRVLVVGCEPLRVGDPEGQEVEAGLTEPVAAAVATAIELIEALLGELCPGPNEGGDR